MHPSFDQAAAITRAARNLGLVMLVAWSALGCGGGTSEPSPSSAGEHQAGGSGGSGSSGGG
jgi:hypothetical protein